MRRDHMGNKREELTRLMLTVRKRRGGAKQQIKHSSSSCRSRTGSDSSRTAFPFPLSNFVPVVPEDSGNISVVSSCTVDPNFSSVISTSSSSNEVYTKSSS